MKTTNEILAETGLTYPMLNRLKDLGIVPKPKLKGLGRHKGVIGEYEDNVIDVINWVNKQRKHGQSLTQIAGHLRQAKTVEGEIEGPKSDASLVSWAARRFIELHARYPNDEFVPGEIDERFEERLDGTVIAKFRLTRVPRKN
jgi:hypothetical protein